MKLLSILLLAALPFTARPQGTVEGRVELPKSHGAPVMNKRYTIVAKGGVLSPYPPIAVVYLEGTFPPAPTAPAARMVQKDLMLVPALLPIRVGTRVEFPTLDNTYHNIFSYSAAKRFDLGRYRSDERPIPAETFDVAGLVTVRCDIHEHMHSLILVLDTPHFVVSDTEGRYRLAGLPAGRYVLRAWLDSKTTLGHPVDLTDGSTLRVNFP